MRQATFTPKLANSLGLRQLAGMIGLTWRPATYQKWRMLAPPTLIARTGNFRVSNRESEPLSGSVSDARIYEGVGSCQLFDGPIIF
jgi:hypothetical protein